MKFCCMPYKFIPIQTLSLHAVVTCPYFVRPLGYLRHCDNRYMLLFLAEGSGN